MLTFGTWNLDAVHRDPAKIGHLADACARLICQEQIDFFVSTETGEQASGIAARLSRTETHSLIFADGRFGVFAGFSPAYVRELRCPMEGRSKTFAIELPDQLPILLTAVYGRDAWTAKSGTQTLVLRQIVENVRWAEQQVGHQRSILLGDFNVNPYSDPALAFDGLHAIMGKREASRGSRQIGGQSAEFFYSPMFRLMDSHDARPPGTFFRSGSDTVEPFWHLLDQVVIRPTLIPQFLSDALRIIDRIGEVELTTHAGRPNALKGSDHLPLVFEMDLRQRLAGESDAEPLA